MAASAWPKPVGSGFGPGIPLRFQRLADSLLAAAVHQDENAEPYRTADGWLGMLSSSRPWQIAAKRP
jgi:hypothetical protein